MYFLCLPCEKRTAVTALQIAVFACSKTAVYCNKSAVGLLNSNSFLKHTAVKLHSRRKKNYLKKKKFGMKLYCSLCLKKLLESKSF